MKSIVKTRSSYGCWIAADQRKQQLQHETRRHYCCDSIWYIANHLVELYLSWIKVIKTNLQPFGNVSIHLPIPSWFNYYIIQDKKHQIKKKLSLICVYLHPEGDCVDRSLPSLKLALTLIFNTAPEPASELLKFSL